MEKIVAVLNGERLSLQAFGDYLAPTTIFRFNWSYFDLIKLFNIFIDHILLRQEAIRTRIIQVDKAEVSDTSVS